ncbi:MAG TPA: hypothetical protein G4O19_03860 [Dehalococcoidia bacterium]|nr:hypothetical protein [Dehalococcoidia bacterium]
METKEKKEDVNGDGDGTLAEVMDQLLKEAENIIEDIGEEVRKELADEISIIHDQFDKKRNQIMEKAKKMAGNKATKITDNIRETLIKQIELSSTNRISDICDRADHALKDILNLNPPQAKDVNKEALVNNKSEMKEDSSKIEGENMVKAQGIDDIDFSTIEIKDSGKSDQSFDDWLKQ